MTSVKLAAAETFTSAPLTLHTANIAVRIKTDIRILRCRPTFALFFFDGYFGRLNGRKNLVTLFQVHSLD
jgi:hypothetical protein